MGDRCYIEFSFRKEDEEKLREELASTTGWGPDEVFEEIDEDSRYPGIMRASVTECNYGWYDEIADAAKSGIPFYGHQAAGSSYEALLFVSLDGKRYEMSCDNSANPYLYVDANLDTDSVQKKCAKAYFDALHKVEELFGELELAKA